MKRSSSTRGSVVEWVGTLKTDRRLVARFLKRRDESAFRELYRVHTPLIYRVVWRFMQDQAEEIVQETWIRAVEGLDRFSWQSSLSTWLTGIALNIVREQRRRVRRAPVETRSEPSIPPPRVGDRVDLERAVGCLPDGYREVLVLHDVEGFTHREIAELLGIEEGTSKSQLHHARQSIRSLYRSSGVQ